MRAVSANSHSRLAAFSMKGLQGEKQYFPLFQEVTELIISIMVISYCYWVGSDLPGFFPSTNKELKEGVKK